MVEKMMFEMSGLVKDKDDKKEIEFWGHDAGEFILEEIEKILMEEEVPEAATVVSETTKSA